jgi:hypothetical protein
MLVVGAERQARDEVVRGLVQPALLQVRQPEQQAVRAVGRVDCERVEIRRLRARPVALGEQQRGAERGVRVGVVRVERDRLPGRRDRAVRPVGPVGQHLGQLLPRDRVVRVEPDRGPHERLGLLVLVEEGVRLTERQVTVGVLRMGRDQPPGDDGGVVRPVEVFEDLGQQPERVGVVGIAGQHGAERPLRLGPAADLGQVLRPPERDVDLIEVYGRKDYRCAG